MRRLALAASRLLRRPPLARGTPPLPPLPDTRRVGSWRMAQTPLGLLTVHVELSGDGTWGAKVYLDPTGATARYSGSSGCATPEAAVAEAVAGIAVQLSGSGE